MANNKNTLKKEPINGIPQDNSSKIDAIKQLLFGENIQEYNSEFEAVKADILKKKKQLEGVIDDVRSELMKSIDNLSTDVNIRITDLETTINDKVDDLDQKKLDRNVLGELFISLGEKINK